LPAGSTLVVSGGNGTGKTTLARILAGLIEPSRGQILVDGLELRQTQPSWWRRQIIYLPQEPTFLNATIEENLRMVNPQISPEELARAIDAAGVRRFLDESPKGLGTLIAGNGQFLALGIRRRLALARALTTDGMVSVFDEPTEGLDADGAAAIYRVMNELHERGRTIIAFSHDPNIVKGAEFFVDLNAKPVPRIGKAAPAGGADLRVAKP
jgi:ATP-binding cassette subfamily C protein LapB